jgi:hypothetical protein
MAEEFDFERYWLGKFADCLEDVAGAEVRSQVMAGSEELSMASPREDVIHWSQEAMELLKDLLPDEHARREVMTGCACQYPKADLQDARQAYQESGDLDAAHRILQAQFEDFLRDTLQLPDDIFSEIVKRGWGLAGIKAGNHIIATKIPKSDFLIDYMRADDPQKKRAYYCHCPRMRAALEMGQDLSPTYCYCGAGFYKGIWEEITGEPVEVEVLESVLAGGEVCKIEITLPVKA